LAFLPSRSTASLTASAFQGALEKRWHRGLSLPLPPPKGGARCNGGRAWQAWPSRPSWRPTCSAGKRRGGALAAVVAASGLVYLAAAALEKPSTAWLVFFGSVIVITAAKRGWIGLDATWILLALAMLFFLYGVWRGVRFPFNGLPLQAIAMLAFGVVAVAALMINDIAGAILVAAGLFGHAAWDVYHHRANRVVTRSMAEFCCVLDVMLAAFIVITTFWH
jgi:hypothetical protein